MHAIMKPLSDNRSVNLSLICKKMYTPAHEHVTLFRFVISSTNWLIMPLRYSRKKCSLHNTILCMCLQLIFFFLQSFPHELYFKPICVRAQNWQMNKKKYFKLFRIIFLDFLHVLLCNEPKHCKKK